MSYPTKGKADYLELGDWNAQCFRCGGKFKASMLKREWQGFYVCDRCWEIRQPQDFARGIPDIQAPPWVQPETANTFIVFCTPEGLSAVPGYGVPGCMVPGYLSPAFNPDAPTTS